MIITFVTTPLLLHKLGTAAYGLQSLVAVVIGYLTFVDMGLDIPIVKLLAQDRAIKDTEAENHLLSTMSQLYFGIGILGLLIIIILSDWLARSVFQMPVAMQSQAVVVFRLAGIGFLGSIGMSWGRAIAMGLQRFDLNYSVSVLLNSGGTIIGLFVVFAGFGIVGYVFTRVIITMFAGPVYFFLIRHQIKSFHFKLGIHVITLRRVREYIGYGLVNRIVSTLVSRLDQTLIGIWVGIAAAGIYAIPFLLVNSITYMLAYMLGFIFPMASELQSLGQMDKLRDIFIRASRFIAALSGLIFIPILIFGDLFLKIWVPSIASSATGVLRLLVLAGFIGTLTAAISNNIMVGLGKIRQFSIYSTIRAAVLAGFCFIFIRSWGLEGAGWALLFTGGVDVIYFIIVLHRYLEISSLQLFKLAYLKPLMLAFVYAWLAFFLRPFATSWLGLSIVCAMLSIIYVASAFALSIFSETEKRAFIELLHRTREYIFRTKDLKQG
jgi:O-antigen/teichoic acid export membrane protein